MYPLFANPVTTLTVATRTEHAVTEAERRRHAASALGAGRATASSKPRLRTRSVVVAVGVAAAATLGLSATAAPNGQHEAGKQAPTSTSHHAAKFTVDGTTAAQIRYP